MCYVNKLSATLTENIHYTLGEGLLRKKIHLPLAKSNTVLLWAAGITPPMSQPK